jgi:hypothetical protein
MKQREVDRAVAQITGETIGAIRRRGFSEVTLLAVFDPEPDDVLMPQTVDWDQLDAQRYAPAA